MRGVSGKDGSSNEIDGHIIDNLLAENTMEIPGTNVTCILLILQLSQASLVIKYNAYVKVQ